MRPSCAPLSMQACGFSTGECYALPASPENPLKPCGRAFYTFYKAPLLCTRVRARLVPLHCGRRSPGAAHTPAQPHAQALPTSSPAVRPPGLRRLQVVRRGQPRLRGRAGLPGARCPLGRLLLA